jgi:hypothetical protein
MMPFEKKSLKTAIYITIKVVMFYLFVLFFKVLGPSTPMISCWAEEVQLSVTKDGYLLQVTYRRCSLGQGPLLKCGLQIQTGKFNIFYLQLSISLADILDITVSLNVHVLQYQLLLSCLVIPLYWRKFLVLSFNHIQGKAYLYVARKLIIC